MRTINHGEEAKRKTFFGEWKKKGKSNLFMMERSFFSLWKLSLVPHTRTRLKTQQQKHLLTNNVCCYSTNRVHRRPQGHQGSGTNAFFFSTIVLGKRSRRFQSARARFSLNSLFAYPTLKDTKITREKKRDRSETMETSFSLARTRERDPSLRA